MGRLMVWLVVVMLVAGGVYTAMKTRYEYFTDGTADARKDRWTGTVQVWGCAAANVRGTESAYFPMAGDSGEPRTCARYGWVTQK